MKRSQVLGALTILGGVFIYNPASSACCVAYDYGHANSQTQKVITEITFKLEQVKMEIVEALRLATGQITNNLKQQTAAQERLMSAQTDQQYNLERKARRAEAVMRRESAPSACAELTSSTSGAAADIVSDMISSQMQQVSTAWRTGKEGSPSAAGPAAAINWSVQLRGRKYTCSDGQELWLTPGTVPACDADTQAMTLFKSPVMDQPSIEAAQAFLRNVYDPIPDGAVPKALEDGNTDVLAVRLSKDARLSLAQEVPSDAVGRRAPSIPQAAWARSIATDIPSLDPASIRDVDGKISWYQWMELKASHRFLSPTWQTKIQSATPEAVMREVALMMAEQMYLDWQRFKLDEKNGMVASANLAIAAQSMRGGSTPAGTLVPRVEAAANQ